MKTAKIAIMWTEHVDVEEELLDKVEAILETQGMTMHRRAWSLALYAR